MWMADGDGTTPAAGDPGRLVELALYGNHILDIVQKDVSCSSFQPHFSRQRVSHRAGTRSTVDEKESLFLQHAENRAHLLLIFGETRTHVVIGTHRQGVGLRVF